MTKNDMLFISHRGNLNGKNKVNENCVKTIKNVVEKGYIVEVDLWRKGDFFYFGHDYEQNLVPHDFLKLYSDKLLIHCKNDAALFELKENNIDFEFFTHTEDRFALSSKNTILVNPFTKTNHRDGILMMPEMSNYNLDEILKFKGVISDNINFYENYYNSLR
tara:strand:- start:219 stop:704 length:486 start_codon:yes stop_codon:yes gene_type:complete